MTIKVRADYSESANNELNVVTRVAITCALNLKDANASPCIHPKACHCNITIYINL